MARATSVILAALLVPPGLPRPDLLVFFTGVAERVGAVGLLFHSTRYRAL
jgi:hypothetical protein